MTRKHVAPHAKRLQKQQERHRKKVWATFKKLARHKACYEPPKGGYMVFGAGFKGRAKKGGYMLYGAGVRRGGMMLRGAGVRKAGYKKKTIKLPAWVSKPIPRSGWPKVPKGFSKSGGAFWNSHSKKAKQVQAKAKSYLGRIWAKGKETVGKLGSAAVSTIKKHGSRLADEGIKFLADHQDQFVDIAGKYMDAQAAKAAGKASATMDKYAAKGKKGSGWTTDALKRGAKLSLGYPGMPASMRTARYATQKPGSAGRYNVSNISAMLKRQQARGLK